MRLCSPASILTAEMCRLGSRVVGSVRPAAESWPHSSPSCGATQQTSPEAVRGEQTTSGVQGQKSHCRASRYPSTIHADRSSVPRSLGAGTALGCQVHTLTPSPGSLRPHPDESACVERGNQNDLRVCLLSPEETPFYIGDCDSQTRARSIKKGR